MKNFFKSSASISLTVLLSTLVVAGIVYASTIKLTAPSGSPTATSSTLGDVYIRLTTNATSTAGNHSLSTTTAPADSFYTLAQIYTAIPTIYPTDFLASSTYLGITGSIVVKTGDNTASSSATSTNKLLLTPPPGYYDGTATVSTTSTNFTASKIASSTNLFGITGTLYGDTDPSKVLTTATYPGTATAAPVALTWQTDPAQILCYDAIYHGCSAGSGLTIDGYGAVEYCQHLNAGGSTLNASAQNVWRLPTITEFNSIADYTVTNNATQVPGFVHFAHYWASTLNAGFADYAWQWSSYDGYTNTTEKNTNAVSVRCVH